MLRWCGPPDSLDLSRTRLLEGVIELAAWLWFLMQLLNHELDGWFDLLLACLLDHFLWHNFMYEFIVGQLLINCIFLIFSVLILS